MGTRATCIYICGEYFNEVIELDEAIHEAYDSGMIGKKVARSRYDFDTGSIFY